MLGFSLRMFCPLFVGRPPLAPWWRMSHLWCADCTSPRHKRGEALHRCLCHHHHPCHFSFCKLQIGVSQHFGRSCLIFSLSGTDSEEEEAAEMKDSTPHIIMFRCGKISLKIFSLYLFRGYFMNGIIIVIIDITAIFS